MHCFHRNIIEKIESNSWIKYFICVICIQFIIFPFALRNISHSPLFQSIFFSSLEQSLHLKIDHNKWNYIFNTLGLHNYIYGHYSWLYLLLLCGVIYLFRKNSFYPEERYYSYILSSLYCIWLVITFIAVLKHEPWPDELNVWITDKYLSIPQVWKDMKYEGHFMLFNLILYPFAKLNSPVITMNIISWFLNSITMYFFIRKTKFSIYIKVAIMFSVPFLYINPAISRPYVLIPGLLFIIAYYYPEIDKKPIRIGILVALLANTHIYIEGFVASFGLMYIINYIILPWKTLDIKTKRNRIIAISIGILGVIIATLQVIFAFSSSNVLKGHSYTITSDKIFNESLAFCNGLNEMFINHIFTCLLVMEIILLIEYKIFKTNKSIFFVMNASLVYMFLFAIMIYGSGVINRSVLWFYIIIFSFLIINIHERYIKIFMFLLCLSFVSAEWNLNDYHKEYFFIQNACKFLKEQDSSIPIFTNGEDWRTVYSKAYIENIYDYHSLDNVKNFAEERSRKEYKKETLQNTLNHIFTANKFDKEKIYILFYEDMFDLNEPISYEYKIVYNKNGPSLSEPNSIYILEVFNSNEK